MLKLAHQTSLKSYILISIPKSYEVLTTSNIRSSWGQFNNCSKSFIWPLGRYRIIAHLGACPYMRNNVTMDPVNMKSWPKVKLDKIGAHSNIAQIHSSSLYEVISDHYLPQFTWKVTKCEIKSSCSQFEQYSRSLI